jgi:hypothetical protein
MFSDMSLLLGFSIISSLHINYFCVLLFWWLTWVSYDHLLTQIIFVYVHHGPQSLNISPYHRTNPVGYRSRLSNLSNNGQGYPMEFCFEATTAVSGTNSRIGISASRSVNLPVAQWTVLSSTCRSYITRGIDDCHLSHNTTNSPNPTNSQYSHHFGA